MHAFSKEPFIKKQIDEEVGEKRLQGKIHPVLKKWISEKDNNNNKKERVMINFRDDLKLPRFPVPIIEESRKSATNKKALRRSEELIREIMDHRVNNYNKLTQEIGDAYNCQVLETFWLINAGTGLGLFISKNIIEAHGGRIWAINNGSHGREEKGATFFFTLPISSQSLQ